MERARPSRARRRILPSAAFGVCHAMTCGALAADSSELWPEVSAFVGLNDIARLYLDASYARGKESDTRSLDLSAFVDISIQPVLREQLRTQDWQRSRYLWTRVGYTRVEKSAEGAPQPAENRGSVALYGKAALPAEVWLEGRARADLRWIGGDYSTRYRFRVEATREWSVAERTVVPYANAEVAYDTRYDGWARALYQVGAEITLDRHFRYEIYLGRQSDRLPQGQTLNALGLVAKWYH